MEILELKSILPEQINFKIKEEIIELDDFEREKQKSFSEHLNKASKIVKTWPIWKQRVLG